MTEYYKEKPPLTHPSHCNVLAGKRNMNFTVKKNERGLSWTNITAGKPVGENTYENRAGVSEPEQEKQRGEKRKRGRVGMRATGKECGGGTAGRKRRKGGMVKKKK